MLVGEVKFIDPQDALDPGIRFAQRVEVVCVNHNVVLWRNHDVDEVGRWCNLFTCDVCPLVLAVALSPSNEPGRNPVRQTPKACSKSTSFHRNGSR
jgi:hypothetical protein